MDPRITRKPDGEPIQSYGPPPEAFHGLSKDEQIELARRVTESAPRRKPKDDD